MRIIHIGNVNRQANGVGQVIKNLSSAQLRNGNEVVVLTALQKQEQLDGFREIHKLDEFKKLIDSFNPDILIFHSLYVWEYIKFYKYLIKKRIPYLIQLHGALSKENYKKNFIKKWLANTLFYNKFIKNAKSIIYLNINEYKQSIVKNINHNCVFIPNGCPDVPPLQKEIRKDEKIEILYLGRIKFHHKGLDRLITAIRILQKENYSSKVHFSIYGTGDQMEVNKLQDELENLSDIAHFFGPVYGDDKNNVYKKSNIFILTSRYEGMPMGILEALSFRLPCIITEGTNMNEIIHKYNCGWISDVDPKNIAKIIKNAVVQYKVQEKTLEDNCQIASQQFTWSKIAKDSINLYSKYLTKYIYNT